MATDSINVGGIIYRMDGSTGVNYMYRGSNDFITTFTPIAEKIKISLPTIRQLFQKYMNASPYAEQDYGSIEKNDKILLKKILEAYLQQLQFSKDVSGNSIISIMLDRTYIAIRQILLELDEGPDYKAVSLPCKSYKKELGKIPQEIRQLMILELSWLLSHPNQIRTPQECLWAEKISELSNFRLRDMTKYLTTIKDVSTDIKSMSDEAVKDRIQQLLYVVGVARASKELESNATQSKQSVQQNGGMNVIFTTALTYAMNPLFDYIQSKYYPVYHLLETCFKKTHAKKQKILPQLLTLLHISNYFLLSQHRTPSTLSLAYGIYRIRSVEKDLVHFIMTHILCSSKHIGKMSKKKQKAFMEALEQLFSVRISSLPKQKSVSPFVTDVEIPSVRFMTLDGNLTIPPFETFFRSGEEHKRELYYQSINDFFTSDDIYMVYSPSEEIPMNVYEINFADIDTTNCTIPITTPLISFPKKHLHELCTTDEHAIYTNAELVLSIFIALKVHSAQ